MAFSVSGTDYGIVVNGTRDTYSLAVQLKRENLLEVDHLGLCDLALAVLHIYFPKQKNVSLSNWEVLCVFCLPHLFS